MTWMPTATRPGSTQHQHAAELKSKMHDLREGRAYEIQQSDGTQMIWYSAELYNVATAVRLVEAIPCVAHGHTVKIVNVTTGHVAYRRDHPSGPQTPRS
jgi:hypothetical protein